MLGMWDAKNNHRDYGMARNFESGLRDGRTLLGTLVTLLVEENRTLIETASSKDLLCALQI